MNLENLMYNLCTRTCMYILLTLHIHVQVQVHAVYMYMCQSLTLIGGTR